MVCPSVCLTDLNSGNTGNKAARERYTRLQPNNRSKNNVADLAKTAAFWQEKPAPPWIKFCDPTHQLARCACVFITCTTGYRSAAGAALPRVLRCCIIDATSSAASLFQNRCIRYQGMQLYTAWLFLPYVVLASFSPAQLQTRKQIVFAPRVCTLVLFILIVLPHYYRT